VEIEFLLEYQQHSNWELVGIEKKFVQYGRFAKSTGQSERSDPQSIQGQGFFFSLHVGRAYFFKPDGQ
jgi:hypothetical protein